MRVLITGGLGFIGGRLAHYLLKAGYQIIIGSRKVSNPPAWLEQAEVEEIKWDDAIALKKSCLGIDIVIHAAGINAQDCMNDPEAALEFNGEVTARFVEAASKAGVKRFIYLSTAHVYSNPLVGVITEESYTNNPHPYASSHLVGDHAVLDADYHGKIQGIVLRLSNAFGAPMHKDINCWMLLVNDLCKQVVLTHKMILKSSGLQERDFISISQVRKTIEQLVFIDHQSAQSSIYNIGSGDAQSVISMAELISYRCFKVLGFKPSINFKKGASDNNNLRDKLYYRSDKLDALGIKYSNEVKVEEIDNLLLFCQSKFV